MSCRAAASSAADIARTGGGALGLSILNAVPWTVSSMSMDSPFALCAEGHVKEQGDPVRLGPDLVPLHRAEVERVLPASVDGQVHRVAGIGLEGVADDRGGGVAHPNLRRRPIRRLHPEHLVQLAVVEHLLDDVAAADEFPIDVELRNRRPVGEPLDAFADPLVLEHVERRVVRHQGVQDADGGGGEAALRLHPRALHEQHHPIGLDEGFDSGFQRLIQFPSDSPRSAPWPSRTVRPSERICMQAR